MAETKEHKLLDRARKNLKKAQSAEDHNRKEAIEDLKFRNGEQWSGNDKKQRDEDNRPTLVYNMLPKFIDQVVGDQRQNRPRIKIRPESSDADVHIAKIYEGMTRNIEFISKAEIIYDQAFEMAVSCGFGVWRVLTRYIADDSFDQEIIIASIPNPFSVYIDPSAKEPTGADANWAFILQKMSHDEYKEKYPDKKDPGELFKSVQGTEAEYWYEKDSVTIAEYFEKDTEEKTICQLDDGRVMDKDEYKGLKEQLGIVIPAIVKERKTEVTKIKQYMITADEILEEPKEWAGKYIPIIPVYGKELNIEGKRYVRGLTRFAKDPQRMVNYWASTEAETLALAPKAPFIGTPKQFKGFEADWEQANRKNLAYLRYNHDSEAPGEPKRQQPTAPPVALFQAKQEAKAGLEDVMGIYRAALGAPSDEKSGIAIRNRQRESDVGNFAFTDNLSRAIEHTGRIIVDLIPHIYDTERDIRLRNVDDTESFVPVNTTINKAIQQIATDPAKYKGFDKQRLAQQATQSGLMAQFNPLTSGSYGVIVTTGPSYTTQRIESAENMLEFLRAVPNKADIIADLVAKNMDFLDSEEVSLRLRKTLPHGLATPKEEDKNNPPIQPNPLMMAKLQESMAKAAKMKADAIKATMQAQELMSEGPHRRKLEILDALAEMLMPPNSSGMMQ